MELLGAVQIRARRSDELLGHSAEVHRGAGLHHLGARLHLDHHHADTNADNRYRGTRICHYAVRGAVHGRYHRDVCRSAWRVYRTHLYRE